MDSEKYTELTGITVNSSNEARINAAITRTQAILENLLGYTLDEDQRDTNYLDGVTPEFAYRLFPYNKKDKYKHIDPATQIYTIKILKNGQVEDTLEDDEYSIVNDRGIVKYFVMHNLPCGCVEICYCTNPNYQFAVDAEYVFASDAIPNDLLSIWADMVTYYADFKRDVKSETLGSHSYTKFGGQSLKPEEDVANRRIIARYAGPRGQAVRNNTY